MESFDTVVGMILNNWTALKLAVDHGMGGPDPKSKLESMISSILEYLNRKDEDSLPNFLEDVMDDDFNTLLEDDSADEISREIIHVFRMWSEGQRDELTSRLQRLPTKSSILEKYERSKPAMSLKVDSEDSTRESSGSDMETNDEESEWTVVSRKR